MLKKQTTANKQTKQNKKQKKSAMVSSIQYLRIFERPAANQATLLLSEVERSVAHSDKVLLKQNKCANISSHRKFSILSALFCLLEILPVLDFNTDNEVTVTDACTAGRPVRSGLLSRGIAISRE
jgi:hypothetical protein